MNATSFELVTESVDVPKNTGVEGFLLAIRQILKRRQRVQKIEIDARGKVSYSHYARAEDNRTPIEIDFDSVSPNAAIRNADVRELIIEETAPQIVIPKMLARASIDQMFPVAFVTGANTVLFDWIKKETGIDFPDGTAFGLPVLRDRHIPDETLVLATSFGPHGALVDVQRSYKVVMPPRAVPKADPELAAITPVQDAVEVMQS